MVFTLFELQSRRRIHRSPDRIILAEIVARPGLLPSRSFAAWWFLSSSRLVLSAPRLGGPGLLLLFLLLCSFGLFCVLLSLPFSLVLLAFLVAHELLLSGVVSQMSQRIRGPVIHALGTSLHSGSKSAVACGSATFSYLMLPNSSSNSHKPPISGIAPISLLF